MPDGHSMVLGRRYCQSAYGRPDILRYLIEKALEGAPPPHCGSVLSSATLTATSSACSSLRSARMRKRPGGRPAHIHPQAHGPGCGWLLISCCQLQEARKVPAQIPAVARDSHVSRNVFIRNLLFSFFDSPPSCPAA